MKTDLSKASHLAYNGKPIIVALGGNAIIKSGQRGEIEEQFDNTRETTSSLIPLIKNGARLVITHGNGPQVGHRLIMSKNAPDNLPQIPLGVLVADTQGSMGYMIQQTLQNTLREIGNTASVVSIVTQVEVDPDDPMLGKHTKPIGPFFDKETAEKRMIIEPNLVIKEDAGRGYRRYVPSPRPKSIVELNTIKALTESGAIVIACGGGGIPVYYKTQNKLSGIDAVIDKDRASSLLANEIDADLFIIATDTDKVYINYQTPNQKALDTVTLAEAQQYYDEEHFAAGSMKPKVESIINFIRNGGKHAIITTPANIDTALEGKAGTHFIP